MDQTELQSKINNFLEDDEELFISDCKAPIKIDEYDSISGLNDLAGNLAEMQEADDVIAAIANGGDKVWISHKRADQDS